jgi:hypothetical protein
VVASGAAVAAGAAAVVGAAAGALVALPPVLDWPHAARTNAASNPSTSSRYVRTMFIPTFLPY